MKARTDVLIIDKKGGRLCALEKLLNSSGSKVTCVRNKDITPELLKKNWHVILLSGSLADIVSKIREPHSFMPTPILLIYSSRPKGGKDHNLLKNADDFLVQPFSERELIDRIQALRLKQKRKVAESRVHGVYNAFNRIIEATRSGSDDLSVLRAASQEVERMFPCVNCSIIILEENKGDATALDFEGKSIVRSFPIELRRYPEIRRVIETRSPLSIRDAARHPLLKEVRGGIQDKPLYSCLLIPIFSQEEMVGLFFLRSLESKRTFVPIEISFMKMIAVTTASALRNVRLNQSIQIELKRTKTARKEARAKGRTSEELKRSKDFLERVIQHSMDAIIAADMKGVILIFNQAAERITGYKAEEIIGKKNIVNLYFAGGAKDIMKKLRSPHYGGVGKLETCSSGLISKNGEEVPINVSAAVIYNEHGDEAATVGVFHDLRERMEIEKQLRSAQERLLESQRREAVSALAGAAAHELNQPLTSIMGYADLLQRVEKSFSEIAPDSQNLSVLKNAVQVITQETERMAGVVRKLGEITNYETREYYDGVRIMDLGRTGEKDDATLRLAFWESLFKSFPVGIVVLDEETIITRANPQAEMIFGESLVGKSFARYLERSQYTQSMEKFYHLIKGGRGQSELTVKQDDGLEITFFVQAVRIQGQKEFVAIIQDLSRPVQAEKKGKPGDDQEGKVSALKDISEIKSQLLHSEKLAFLGQMTAGIAHEINNPLTAISSYAEMIQLSEIEKGQTRNAERAERILENALRIQNLINNLKGFARPSTGEFSRIDVKELIDQALSFSRHELNLDNLSVEKPIPDQLPRILGVHDQLQQVMINLISNAAHACEGRDSARVVISAGMIDDKSVEISIEDNGIGIDRENLDKIFEPFFTTKEDKGGTGLGLSIVKDIINRHGGIIQVESWPDKGSIFRVSLPLQKDRQVE